MATLSTDMTNETADSMEEALDDLHSAVVLSGDIISAKNGNEAARERLAEPRTLPMRFPGNQDRAMGHALVLIEDLEELGIEAEREYHEQVLPANEHAGALHRIDIHISGYADD